jgi:hypothetical protein
MTTALHPLSARVFPVLSLLIAASSAGCFIGGASPTGKDCDESHACPSPLACVDQVCVALDASAGPSDSGQPQPGLDGAVLPLDAGTPMDAALEADAALKADAATPLPDLVVVGITWSPTSPVEGDPVTFGVTIKNQGTGASPGGVIHGVAFFVDGIGATWTDDHTSSMAAGSSATLTANGGHAGATWTAAAGSHTVLAFVDDVDRIAESDETNNRMTVSLTVTPSGTAVCGDATCNGAETCLSCPGDCLTCSTRYNVKDYGAKGDGATIDTSAIQSAINAAHGAGSGTVYFPSSTGCYVLGGSLTFYSGIDYVGQAPDVCVKKSSGTAA